MKKLILIVMIFISCMGEDENKNKPTGPQKANYPESINAVVGSDIVLYYDNIGEGCSYSFSEDGISTSKYWSYAATRVENFTLYAYSECGNGAININIIEKQTFNNENILVIGDSITAEGYSVKAFAELAGDINFIGTSFRLGYYLEAYGGNTWNMFAYGQGEKSPFVYEDTGLDFKRYFDLNGYPDYVIIMLGANDTFHLSDDARIEEFEKVKNTAFYFIDELKHASPETVLLLSSVTPPSNTFCDDEIFYRDKKNQVEFTKFQRDIFSGLENDNIFYFEVFHGVDSINGFIDCVHPNGIGYQEIGTMFYNEFSYVYSETN